MTKAIMGALAAAVFLFGTMWWGRGCTIDRLKDTVAKLEVVKKACEQQAKIYESWKDIDHATSAKIKKVPGDPAAIANALTELFGGKPVPSPTGTTGGTGQAKP